MPCWHYSPEIVDTHLTTHWPSASIRRGHEPRELTPYAAQPKSSIASVVLFEQSYSFCVEGEVTNQVFFPRQLSFQWQTKSSTGKFLDHTVNASSPKSAFSVHNFQNQQKTIPFLLTAQITATSLPHCLQDEVSFSNGKQLQVTTQVFFSTHRQQLRF